MFSITTLMRILTGAVLAAFVSCSSIQYQKLETDVLYKRDLGVWVNGQYYEGVVVVPQSSRYEIELESPSNIDMILWRSCAREDSGTPKKPGFFSFKSRTRVKYTYTPLSGLENTGTCPLRIDSFDSKNNQHAWAFLIFERPGEMTLPFYADCNGRRALFTGVGACQHKAGLIARLEFSEPVMFATPRPSRCPAPKKVGNNLFKWEMGVGECMYHFRTEDGSIGKFVGVGYEGVLLRGGA